jgi:hypothetical protein
MADRRRQWRQCFLRDFEGVSRNIEEMPLLDQEGSMLFHPRIAGEVGLVSRGSSIRGTE